MIDKNLETFLQSLMIPRTEISGNAICPYLEKYSSQVKYARVKSIDEIVKNNPIIVEDMQSDEGSVFIYIVEWNIEYGDSSYNDIVELKKLEEEKYNDKDIEILFMMKDDNTSPPLEVLKKYAYTENSLFILQRKSTLRKARNELAKKTNYYAHWGKNQEMV